MRYFFINKVEIEVLLVISEYMIKVVFGGMVIFVGVDVMLIVVVNFWLYFFFICWGIKILLIVVEVVMVELEMELNKVLFNIFVWVKVFGICLMNNIVKFISFLVIFLLFMIIFERMKNGIVMSEKLLIFFIIFWVELKVEILNGIINNKVIIDENVIFIVIGIFNISNMINIKNNINLVFIVILFFYFYIFFWIVGLLFNVLIRLIRL